MTEFPVVDIPSPDIPLIPGDTARPALCASRGVPYRTVNRSSSLKLYTRVGDAAPRGVDVIRVRLAEVVDADVIVPRSREKPSLGGDTEEAADRSLEGLLLRSDDTERGGGR